MMEGVAFRRLGLFFWMICGVAVVISCRLFYLQVLKGGYYASVAQNQAQEKIEVDLPRATLLDRNGIALAASTQCPSLYTFDPQKVNDPIGLARAVAAVSGRDADDILKDLRTRRRFTWLARKLSFKDYDRAKDICARFKGCELMEESGRFYPNRELAANLVGCVGTDGGLAGLEHQWNGRLQGGTRSYLVMRDAIATRLIPMDVVPEVDPPATRIRTTIDQAIQYEAEKVLDQTVSSLDAKDGVAIVMDPRKGDILAMAVSPTYDPNNPGRYPPASWRNRAVTDSYEPGSTFKLVTLAAALDSGRYSANDTIFVGDGTLIVGPKTIHDDEPPLKPVYSMEEVLAHSSNVGAAKIGMALGQDTMYHYMRLFGFGEVTPLAMTGESPGRLRPPKEWSLLSLPSLSFGQELRVTPLQLALAFSAVASGGYKIIPRLLPDAPVQPPERILKASTARSLTEMLCQVVTEGTGKAAAVPGVTVAGKTGTAQKLGANSPDGRRLFIAYFVGFAPAEDPRLVVLVMVDEPVGKIYGGSVSAPAFSKIMAYSLKRLSYPEPPSPFDLAMGEGQP
jgi:cell division protein FtsI (penicillin-binding protein 3)